MRDLILAVLDSLESFVFWLTIVAAVVCLFGAQ